MLHTTNPVIKHKAGLLNLAEELSNVSKACKIMGVSRDTFYRYRELADEGGVDALINRSRRVPNLKNRTDEATVLIMPLRSRPMVSTELRKQDVFISGSDVHSVWLRHNLENFKKRLKALEEKVARDGIELTARSPRWSVKPVMMKPVVRLKPFIRDIWGHRTRSTWAT